MYNRKVLVIETPSKLRPIGRVAEGKTAAWRAGARAEPWKAGDA